MDQPSHTLAPHFEETASYKFLHQCASRHFVFLTLFTRMADEPAEKRRWVSISCFVVEVDRFWLMVTAGHVIEEIEKGLERGQVFEDFSLHDEMTGHRFPFGVPTPFDVDDWVTAHADEEGFDYAAARLKPLVVECLRAGGILPLSEEGWDVREPEECRDWLLVGIPTETHGVLPDGRHSLKVTLIPMYATQPPSTALHPSTAKYFAKLRTPQESTEVSVNDIGGMSGGPIFGTYEVEGRLKFCAIGIQSSWYPDSRIAAFCPLHPFLDLMRHLFKEAAQARDDLAG